jgi:hypothetical protein
VQQRLNEGERDHTYDNTTCDQKDKCTSTMPLCWRRLGVDRDENFLNSGLVHSARAIQEFPAVFTLLRCYQDLLCTEGAPSRLIEIDLVLGCGVWLEYGLLRAPRIRTFAALLQGVLGFVVATFSLRATLSFHLCFFASDS